MNRVLDLAETPCKVTVTNGRIHIETTAGAVHDLPLTDLGVVVFGQAAASVSLPALAALAEVQVPVVVSGERSMPVGMLLPIGGHSLVGERIAAQASASVPMRKQAWAAVVKAKLRAQARALELSGSDGALVSCLVAKVRSGDPTNVEAQAARRYWSAMFGDDFRRDREQAGENQFLNYGYGVLRAIVGRAVTAAGLHPSLGLHHRHRANAYPLVDDLIEPFRPVVDLVVREVTRDAGPGLLLDAKRKRPLLEGLTRRVLVDGEARTLFDVSHRMAAALADYLLGKSKRWAPPTYDPMPLATPGGSDAEERSE